MSGLNASHGEEVSALVEAVLGRYLGSLVCGVAVLGNALSLAVLLQPALTAPCYTYLTGLTVTNLVAMALSFVYLVFASPGGVRSYEWGFYTIYIFYPFANICSHSSIWIVLMLTVERFLFVRYPLWARDRCNRRSAKIKITVIILVMFVFNLSRFFQFRLEELPGNNGTVVLNVGNNATFFLAINWFHSIVINFGPLLVLCFCNAYLVVAVRRTLGGRARFLKPSGSTMAMQHQHRLTRTLVAVVLIFIITLTPSAFADRPIACLLFPSKGSLDTCGHAAGRRILVSVSNFLCWTGNAALFFVYCACNSRFLRAVRKLAQTWVGACRPVGVTVKTDLVKMTTRVTETHPHSQTPASASMSQTPL